MQEYIFVYGTLRPYFKHPIQELLSGQCDYVGEGYVFGKLYEIENYPGLTISPPIKNKVYGEIYKLHDHDDILNILDEYEGCSDSFPKPHEYRRIKSDVYDGNGKTFHAWLYVYNHPTEGLETIPSGDYVDYWKKKYDGSR
ncbi:gamma-glutamylcyclotransferase family protein [Hydrogenimonas urashimensis]|uniref:gamma-glutamylcyclotransferase family protein n=1 Tax=Hydrogenimonas urashimensis TaxID=2740515 RepID=UPI0019167DDD|nr:gamma-glutamylcyclotransferase family protein [Hydrogenimonas urashimensis]